MGRIERRRQEKFNKSKGLKNKEEYEFDGKTTFISGVKIVVVIALILLVLYYVVAIFVTKEISFGSNEEDTTQTDSSNDVSDKILAKNIFNQQESEYYVYFYDFDDEDLSISSAIGNISDDKVYRVDTSSSLNSNYVTSESSGNKNAASIDDLKVINPTLIKISNDSIIEYYENVDDIVAFLES